jgi:hypothetical protein
MRPIAPLHIAAQFQKNINKKGAIQAILGMWRHDVMLKRPVFLRADCDYSIFNVSLRNLNSTFNRSK